MLGPFSASVQVSLHPCHVNRFGVIPKGRNTGKWRLITDLLFPPRLSVNDGIDRDLCSLAYTSVDKVAEVIAELPLGALLAKIDIESAYRLVPVHSLDHPLQAGALYADLMLPFGLWLAPKILTPSPTVVVSQPLGCPLRLPLCRSWGRPRYPSALLRSRYSAVIGHTCRRAQGRRRALHSSALR
jgi:hypothetical protein